MPGLMAFNGCLLPASVFISFLVISLYFPRHMRSDEGHCALLMRVLLGFDCGRDYRLGGLVLLSSISAGLD